MKVFLYFDPETSEFTLHATLKGAKDAASANAGEPITEWDTVFDDDARPIEYWGFHDGDAHNIEIREVLE